MEPELNDTEVRILGCLVEKEITTPDYYPLTLNALANACNQKSNRDPIVSYDEAMVDRALHGLMEKDLADTAAGAGSRVTKYRHRLRDKLYLGDKEIALLCMLMLRGPQTLGELKGRTERMVRFENLPDVEQTLNQLAACDPPRVFKLARQPGRKEQRYVHLLSGPAEQSAESKAAQTPAMVLRQTLPVQTQDSKISELEQELAKLRSEFQVLREELADLRGQLGSC